MTLSLSQIINVALVLAVVYYVMSMLISSVTKWALELFETRGKVLEEFLRNNLEKGAGEAKKFTVEELRKLPQINSLRPVRYAGWGLGRLIGKTKLSDHVERIQPKVLVDALFDLEGTAADWQTKVKSVIGLLPESIPNLGGDPTPFTAKNQLIASVDKAYYSFDQWREKLETYFGSVMDQAAHKFAALAKTYALLISLVAAFALGVDSIQIAGRAWFDPQLTQKADAYAETILGSEESGEKQQDDIETLYGTLEGMAVINLPFFAKPTPAVSNPYPELVSPYTEWSLSQPYGLWLFYRILGLIITGIAVSQGSSFWYDIIRQIKGEARRTEPAAGEASGSAPGYSVEPLAREVGALTETTLGKPPQQ